MTASSRPFAVVTGGTNGIGLGLFEEFLANAIIGA